VGREPDGTPVGALLGVGLAAGGVDGAAGRPVAATGVGGLAAAGETAPTPGVTGRGGPASGFGAAAGLAVAGRGAAGVATPAGVLGAAGAAGRGTAEGPAGPPEGAAGAGAPVELGGRAEAAGCTGRGGSGAALACGGAAARGVSTRGAGLDLAGSASPSRRTANTALHTLHRARTPAAGTLAGSIRYTVAQFGQVTFMSSPQGFSREAGPGRSSPLVPCRRSTTKTDPGSVFA
jgi:hypothetical protein